MATAALPAAPAAAHARGKWNPDTHSPRFTLVVMPDTQYLFDEDRGDLLPLGKWWHVAMVNDGNHTIMYVDGCPVLRNPSTSAIGVATAGKPWLVGAYHYADVVEQAYYGWLGDVRIVGRALRPDQFLNA
jgi:hypothetical protein